MQQHPEPVCFPSIPVARALVQSPAAPHGDGGQVAAQHGDPQLQAEVLASLKELRAAFGALTCVVCAHRDSGIMAAVYVEELERIGVDPGFGARADVLILRLEGRL